MTTRANFSCSHHWTIHRPCPGARPDLSAHGRAGSEFMLNIEDQQITSRCVILAGARAGLSKPWWDGSVFPNIMPITTLDFNEALI